MQEIMILIKQVAVILILTIIGYIAGKTRYLPENTGNFLSKVIIRLAAPALILSTMISYNFDKKTISDGIWVSLLGIAFMMLGLFLGTIASRLLKLKGGTAVVFKLHSFFGNIAYMGIPLLKAMLGDRAVVLGAFFIISFEFTVWSLGVYMLNRGESFSILSTFKKLLNANTISCFIGLVFAFANLKPLIQGSVAGGKAFEVIYATLSSLGSCTLPLIMVFIGLTVAESKAGSFFALLKKPLPLAISIIKLLILPLLSFGIMQLFSNSIDPFVRTIVTLDLAMPCAAIIVALASEYGADHEFAGENVVYTTVLSLFTLPLFMLLISYVN